MKTPWKLPGPDRVLGFVKQYKYVLMVAAAGLVLLLWPAGQDQAPQAPEQPGVAGDQEDFSVQGLEERLAQALSKIQGAGEVSVVLTVEQGMERVLATDRVRDQGEGALSTQEETVVLSTDAGEEAVLVTQRYPTFQGALIVCPGGDDPAIQLVLTQAVADLTGLGTDRITVCRGS